VDRNTQKRSGRQNRKTRVRRKVVGSMARPRLTVYRSLQHIYAQIIDDESGTTLVTASSMGRDLREDLKNKKNVDAARAIGSAIAKKALARDIKQVVFDRNGYAYHGRVKALADAAREAGLDF